jgi:NTE family protein
MIINDKQTKKRGLVLSGGGSHGAYQIGVLKALAEKNKVGWDVISGVSVGSINALYLGMSNNSGAKEAVQQLENLWGLEISGNSSVYKPWYFFPFNYVASLWKGSLYNTKPLEKLLDKNFVSEKLLSSDVDTYVGAVSLNTGVFRHERLKESADPVRWVLASSTMPILFNPVELENQKWVDGGVKSVTPFKEVLNLKEYEFDHIDIIMADPPTMHEDSNKFTSVLEVAKKSLECAINEIMVTDIETMNFSGTVSIYYPEVGLKYDAFDFIPKDLNAAIEQGYRETIKKL